ncbi:MAG: hypothetical protein WC685_03360 [Methylobacter sp.]|jgi:hypothetical protein
MNSQKDSIYASFVGDVGAFKFDEKLAQNRLQQVGFSSAEVGGQFFNFTSIIALK